MSELRVRQPSMDDLFIEYLSAQDSSSVRSHLKSWSKFLYLRKIGTNRAGANELAGWMSRLRSSGATKDTIDDAVGAVHSFYEWAASQGLQVNTNMLSSGAQSPRPAKDTSAPRKGPTNESRRAVKQPTGNDLSLMEAFVGTLPTANSKAQSTNILKRWLLFLNDIGASAASIAQDDNSVYSLFVGQLKVSDQSAQVYLSRVRAFQRWLHQNSNSGASAQVTKPPKSDNVANVKVLADAFKRKRPTAPISADEELKTRFLSTLEDESLRLAYTSSMDNWFAYLAKNRSTVRAANGRLKGAWLSQLAGTGVDKVELENSIAFIKAFYKWLGEEEAPTATANVTAIAVPEPVVATAQPDSETPASPLLLSPGRTSKSKTALDNLVEQVAKLSRAIEGHWPSSQDHAPVPAAQPSIQDGQLDYIITRQGNIERKVDALVDNLALALDKMEAIRSNAHASYSEQVAYLDELKVLKDQMAKTLYKSGDSSSREVLCGMPASAQTCAGEVELLLNGCFNGLQITNADIIDSVSSLDKAPQARTWAEKVHNALVALSDYAQSGFNGDFKRFCEAKPSGHSYISEASVARHEPAATSNNKQRSEERTFPVPKEVDPSGKIYMPEHIILGNGGISPRLHYLDDTKRTGKVYIGYLGPHLLSRDTN